MLPALAAVPLALALASSTAAFPAVSSTATAARHGLQARSALIRGVNIEYDGPRQIDSDIANAAELHAQAVRVLVRWSQLEPAAPGQIASAPLALLDRLVREAAARGIKVIMVVDGTPCWASSAPDPIRSRCQPTLASEAKAWPPLEPARYAEFVAYLAARYGSGLAALEIWNEPDQANEKYLAGPEKAAHYAAILRAAYPAVKAVDPSLPVIGGSFVGPNGAFLRNLYEAGIEGYYDGLAVHFYTLTLAALRVTREVQLQHGDTKPLWLDEFGWSSCWPHEDAQQEQGCVTRRVQAANLVSTTRALARTPSVAAEVFYKLRNTSQESFGVLTASGERKPSFAAVARAFASPLGPLAPVRVRLHAAAGRVTASGSGPVGDFLVLEALERGRLRYSTYFTLDRFDRYRVQLPRALGTRHLAVRVYVYGRGVRSAVTRRL
jgi:hypothetical protein